MCFALQKLVGSRSKGVDVPKQCSHPAFWCPAADTEPLPYSVRGCSSQCPNCSALALWEAGSCLPTGALFAWRNGQICFHTFAVSLNLNNCKDVFMVSLNLTNQQDVKMSDLQDQAQMPWEPSLSYLCIWCPWEKTRVVYSDMWYRKTDVLYKADGCRCTWWLWLAYLVWL